MPPVFWYDNSGVQYGVVYQTHRAPLVVLIAGTGASSNSDTSKQTARALYAAGMHVLGLPSPTHPNFIVNGSESGVPGRLDEDARDLYRVIQLVLAEVKDRVDISEIDLAGYSLGAMHAAWVADLDQREHAVGFQRVLLLNPPVSLWNSVQILDGMYDRNVPPGAAGAENIVDRIFEKFADVYTREQDTNFDGDFLYNAYQALDPTPKGLETLIGISFRLLLDEPRLHQRRGERRRLHGASRRRPRATTSLTSFFKDGMRKSFGDYIDGIYVPFFRARDPAYTKQQAIREAGLRPLETFLRDDPKNRPDHQSGRHHSGAWRAAVARGGVRLARHGAAQRGPLRQLRAGATSSTP